MKELFRVAITAICILMLGFSFMGGCFDGNEDDNPVGSGDPPADTTLKAVAYNGHWIYVDFHDSDEEFLLEDVLFMEDDTDWAHITFVDYEDTNRTDLWTYQERNDDGDILLRIEGKMEITSDAMFMSYQDQYDDWVYFFSFNFGQASDTLPL